MQKDAGISIHALREEGDRIASPHLETHSDFYPRPPRGGRPYNGHPVIRKYIISTPALREEGDDGFADAVNYFFISIHALREEGDGRASTGSRLMVNFYPRPPRGGRRTHYRREINRWRFLSTPSARRATRGSAAGAPPLAISIHALREEGDMKVVLILAR